MNAREIHLAPGVPDLDSIGVRSFEDLFRAPGSAASGGWDHASFVGHAPGLDVIRVVRADAGSLLVKRFASAKLGELCRARFTHPRSTSLAEREWNLLCHLRAHGVGTPQPLAVARGEGAVFARRSALVLSPPDGLKPLADWAGPDVDRVARNRIARAVGFALARVFQARTFLPRTTSRNLLVGVPRVLSSTGEAREPGVEGLRWGPLPEVVFTEMSGGVIRRRLTLEQRAAMLESLADEIDWVEPGSAFRVLRACVPHGSSREQRKVLLRALAFELTGVVLRDEP